METYFVIVEESTDYGKVQNVYSFTNITDALIVYGRHQERGEEPVLAEKLYISKLRLQEIETD